jgi:hypothetical protein
MRKKSLGTSKLAGFCALASLVLAPLASAAGGVFEEQNPSFEKIDLRLWQANPISRCLGAESNRLHAYAGEFFKADDNIYLTDGDEESDSIWVSLFGVDTVFEKADFYKLRLAAEYRTFNYRHHDNDKEEYFLTPSLDYIINEMMTLNIHGKFAKTSSPLDEDGVALGKPEEVERKTNSIGLDLGIAMSEAWGMHLKWDMSKRNYMDSYYDGLEYTQNTFALAPYYMLSDKTTLDASLTFGTTDYSYGFGEKTTSHNEASWVQLMGGVTTMPTERLTLYAGLGFQDRNYDDDNNPADTDDFNGMVYNAYASFMANEKLNYSLSLSRSAVEGSSSNYYTLDRQAATVSYKPITPLKFAATVFTEQVKQSSTADSNRKGASLSADWAFSDYMGVGASYQHKNNNSDATGGDYKTNVTTMGFWLQF